MTHFNPDNELYSCFSVEDQKEIPSPVNPELRHKEVQMNFFNQLTSVFNPDITVLASPAAHMQVSESDMTSKIKNKTFFKEVSDYKCANKTMAYVSQGENECDDQTTTDQATQAKMKNAFISQNVSSLQELGELLHMTGFYNKVDPNFYGLHCYLVSLQGAQRSCCACASTFPTFYGISTDSRMRYLPTLSSSCRPPWQTPPLSEMGKTLLVCLIF